MKFTDQVKLYLDLLEKTSLRTLSVKPPSRSKVETNYLTTIYFNKLYSQRIVVSGQAVFTKFRTVNTQLFNNWS